MRAFETSGRVLDITRRAEQPRSGEATDRGAVLSPRNLLPAAVLSPRNLLTEAILSPRNFLPEVVPLPRNFLPDRATNVKYPSRGAPAQPLCSLEIAMELTQCTVEILLRGWSSGSSSLGLDLLDLGDLSRRITTGESCAVGEVSCWGS